MVRFDEGPGRNQGGQHSILDPLPSSGPQRSATQRNATYWKPVEYVVYEQECTTAISHKSLRSPTRPATHARFVVPSSPATTHGCCTRREDKYQHTGSY